VYASVTIEVPYGSEAVMRRLLPFLLVLFALVSG
jgi:hypothetical protein